MSAFEESEELLEKKDEMIDYMNYLAYLVDNEDDEPPERPVKREAFPKFLTELKSLKDDIKEYLPDEHLCIRFKLYEHEIRMTLILWERIEEPISPAFCISEALLCSSTDPAKLKEEHTWLQTVCSEADVFDSIETMDKRRER